MKALDFDYYGGRDLTAPKMPCKPVRLGLNPTVSQARDYADALELWEAEMVSYRAERALYQDQMNTRLRELQTKLRDEYDITEAQQFILWNSAWRDGHSEGLNRVVDIFNELYEVASEFAALEKG